MVRFLSPPSIYLVVWCSRVCMWSGRAALLACSDDIYEIERRDSCQQRVFIWREMHGRLWIFARSLRRALPRLFFSLSEVATSASLLSMWSPLVLMRMLSITLFTSATHHHCGDTKPTKKGAQNNTSAPNGHQQNVKSHGSSKINDLIL